MALTDRMNTRMEAARVFDASDVCGVRDWLVIRVGAGISALLSSVLSVIGELLMLGSVFVN